MHEDAGARRRRRMLLLVHGRSSSGEFASVPHLADDLPASAAPSEPVAVDEALFQASGGNSQLTLVVEDLARRPLREQKLDRPILQIGQGPENDLWLEHERILRRHALLIWLNGSIFYMALSSKAELLVGKGLVTSGWWTPNLALRVGSFRLRVPGLHKAPPEFDPLAVSPSLEAELSRLEFRFLGQASPNRPWIINRPLTLIGRGSVCKIRLDHPEIQSVQAALIRTAGRLWLVNLAQTEHTRVNGNPIATAMLDVGDIVQFGSFEVEVRAAGEWTGPVISKVKTKAVTPDSSSADVSRLIRQLAEQHQKLLQSHLQSLRDLEHLANQTTDASQLKVIRDLIRKTYLAVEDAGDSAANGSMSTHST